MWRMIYLSALPLGLLITAPLAEYVFEPSLNYDGALAGSLRHSIGWGQGMALACCLC
jgi:hypothetical protein